MLYGKLFYKVNISRIVAMLNGTLQIYLLVIFKLTHIPIESRDRNTKFNYTFF